jgi:broad specificity phosphatase PhoE
MVVFSQMLPHQFNQPLPAMMVQLTPRGLPAVRALGEAEVRQLADAVAIWHFRSPLGLCLRRSLLRYHFLRAAQVPVSIVFGARLKSSQEGGGIGGHAWLARHGQPYFEQPGDYQDFAIMYVYPPNPS